MIMGGMSFLNHSQLTVYYSKWNKESIQYNIRDKEFNKVKGFGWLLLVDTKVSKDDDRP